mmetsp:Transcript_23252/g.65291  ORF Transcript_23252/g.65291 Transcript_23252/m.65291 type:complete len:142 (+) Transcript_23252:87-512(+)
MVEEDISMGEAGAEEREEQETTADDLLPPDESDKPKVVIRSSEFPGCTTYVLRDEDHTMGNSLRWALNKSRDVNFVGYTTPHPTENRLHLRVQTADPEHVTTEKVVDDAFNTLESMMDHMITTYENAIKTYAKKDAEEMES